MEKNYVKKVNVGARRGSSTVTITPHASGSRPRQDNGEKKKCTLCAQNMPESDPHAWCVKCLGFNHAWEAVHQPGACVACNAMEPRFSRLRLDRATATFEGEQHERNRRHEEDRRQADETGRRAADAERAGPSHDGQRQPRGAAMETGAVQPPVAEEEWQDGVAAAERADDSSEEEELREEDRAMDIDAADSMSSCSSASGDSYSRSESDSLLFVEDDDEDPPGQAVTDQDVIPPSQRSRPVTPVQRSRPTTPVAPAERLRQASPTPAAPAEAAAPVQTAEGQQQQQERPPLMVDKSSMYETYRRAVERNNLPWPAETEPVEEEESVFRSLDMDSAPPEGRLLLPFAKGFQKSFLGGPGQVFHGDGLPGAGLGRTGRAGAGVHAPHEQVSSRKDPGDQTVPFQGPQVRQTR